MNIKLFVLISLILLASCSTHRAGNTSPNPMPTVPLLAPEPPAPEPPDPPDKPRIKYKIPSWTVEKKLNSYFRNAEIKPAIIINNLYSGIRNERVEKINIADHNVVWFHSYNEAKVKINNDLFSLKDEITLNAVSEKKSDKVDFANNWDQIKLFKFGKRELIGISMFNDPCTGIGCRVQMYLIYDLKTKSKNFFGTYRFMLDREFGLYDFANNGKLSFLCGTYFDASEESTNEFQNLYQIFTMNNDGAFQLQSNREGKPYHLKRVYKEENYEEVEDKFEQNWIEEIR